MQPVRFRSRAVEKRLDRRRIVGRGPSAGTVENEPYGTGGPFENHRVDHACRDPDVPHSADAGRGPGMAGVDHARIRPGGISAPGARCRPGMVRVHGAGRRPGAVRVHVAWRRPGRGSFHDAGRRPGPRVRAHGVGRCPARSVSTAPDAAVARSAFPAPGAVRAWSVPMASTRPRHGLGSTTLDTAVAGSGGTAADADPPGAVFTTLDAVPAWCVAHGVGPRPGTVWFHHAGYRRGTVRGRGGRCRPAKAGVHDAGRGQDMACVHYVV